MSDTELAATALKSFLGVWQRVPSPEGTEANTAIYTILPDGTDARFHARWQGPTGDFHQVAFSAPLDGRDQPQPAQGLVLTGRFDGPDLVTELLHEGRVAHRATRSLDEAGTQLTVVQEVRGEGGGWEEQVAVYTRAQVKQVLAYRRDLQMRKGKIAAQCAHASISVFTRLDEGPAERMVVPLDGPMAWWVRRSMAKIVLSVETEADLLAVHAEAKRRLLPTALIRDAGRTEFKGVPTLTTVAIGPAAVVEIDPITGKDGLVVTKLA